MTQMIDRLNHYTKQIVSADKNCDLFFLVSNIGIYSLSLSRQTICEVQTSSIAQCVDKINQNERHLDKIINEEEKSNLKNLKVENVINKRDIELRFDGSTRVQAMEANRLLVFCQDQRKFVIHFKFDQADIDIAAVDFIKIDVKQGQGPPEIIPSSLSICP